MTAAYQSGKSYNGAIHAVSVPSVGVKGVAITTGGTAIAAAIPNTSTGFSPNYVRLAATAACYVRLGRPSETSAVVATAGTGYVTGDSITLTGGTASVYAILAPETLKLLTAIVGVGGTGYVPADTITLAGGTSSVKAIATVATTKAVSAVVAAAGTGGTPGTATVTGTTGTGTKFQASVTIEAGGTIASVDSITVAGSYTVNPTNLAAEPVTGGSLTGATLTIEMGVNTVTVTTAGNYSVSTPTFTQFSTSGAGVGATFTTGVYGLITASVSNPGSYTVLPTNPVAQGSTSGAGTGADFTMTWTTAAAAGDILIQPGDSLVVGAEGFDSVSAIQVTAAGILQVTVIDS